MFHKPNRRVEVPGTDLLTWVFGNEDCLDQDRPLYVDALDPSRAITFSQARSIIRSIIKGLRASGVKEGDCVCLHSFNDVYYPLIFLGVIGAGAVFLGSNPGYKELELTSLFESANPTLVITAPDLLPTVQNVAKELDITDSQLLVFSQDIKDHGSLRPWTELLKHGEGDWVCFDDEAIARDTPACLVTTSGTTGMPKLAILSHYSWVAFNSVVDDPVPKPYEIKRLIFLPMFHTFAAPLAHLAPLREGHTTYIMPRFSMSQFIYAVESFAINEVLLVPPMIVTLVNSTVARDFLGRIRFVWSGGAPLEAQIVKKFYRLLAADACLAQVYGMTEAGWISTLKWPERDESGSVGRLLANVEAKLINPRNNLIQEPGKRGEICIRSPRLMTGYLGNARATADSFVEGWLKTGDVGTVDRQGRIFIVDRQKDLIKGKQIPAAYTTFTDMCIVRGWQVSPAELEGVLRAHPNIADAAVMGVKHNNSEAPRALVVRKSHDLSEAAVKAYIAGLLVGYKHLDGGVSFVESIPKSPSGKILRKLLHE